MTTDGVANATARLHALGQSLWLDNITRGLLIEPDTINTIPEDTLRAFAEHGRLAETMPADGGDADATLRQFAAAGVDVTALAGQLQREGAQSFADSWNKLMRRLASKTGSVQ
jgi:transaldolase